MLARRLLLLAAALLLLAAVAAAVAPAPPGSDAAPARTSLPPGGVVSEQIPADTGSDVPVGVKRGDVLELEVSGDMLDTVLIERLDRIDAIEPTTPARFEFLVDAPAGVYPIRLVDADRRIGTIKITD